MLEAGRDTPFAGDFEPDAVSKKYALGWFREEFTDGTTLLQHGGNVDGFSSLIAFLPEHDLGLVVLTNLDVSPFGDPYVLNVWRRCVPNACPTSLRVRSRIRRLRRTAL